MTGRRGRRRRKLLDDLKEGRRYCHLKEEALDRAIWRAGFGRGFGPFFIFIIIIIIIINAIRLSPGGSGYFTCIQNMKLVINKFKSGGLHEKHVVATWNVGNRLSICL